ncbi:MAG: hypothetical protein Q7S03_00285 [bacterium]|nr:hypothetical protein [bacterium]
MYNLIKQLDPANIDIWWNLIIRKESQYDPNAVNENRIECPTEICFGLFQMGSGVINGPIDNGYTDWVAQAKNAVAWNNNLASKGCQWTYWGTAKNLWPNNPECYK